MPARGDLADLHDWWLAEFWASVLSIFAREQRFANYTLVVGKDSFALREQASGNESELGANDLVADLSRLVSSGRRRELPVLDLILQRGRYLQRHLAPFRLPRRRASDMVLLDLQSSTPLDPETVTILFAADDVDRNGQRYFIVKQEVLKPLLAAVEQAPACLGTIWAETDDGPVALDASGLGELVRTRWRDRLRRGMFTTVLAASVVMGLATFIHAQWRYGSSAAQLDAEIEALSAEVKVVRALSEERRRRVEQIQSVRAQREQAVPLASILDELTRLVPDDSWISDLAIEGTEVSFSGISPSAAGLISTLDASPLFSGPTFTAPVTKSPDAQGGERFAIAMKLERG
jgi:general secretion pathway protein L